MRSPNPHKSSRQAASAPRVVRIIGGAWRRTPLDVVSAPGLRPTPDRVRETVFNWLTHLFGGSLNDRSALDLFAGTGAFGFEAASRGARAVLCVESHAQVAQCLSATKERLRAEQVTVTRADALATAQWLVRTEQQFDVIFLDPPFFESWLPRVLPLAARLVSDSGLIYVEAEAPLESALLDANALELVRTDKAGQVFYHLLQCKKEESTGEPEC